jgi:uncharacterized spore protein YtfJ
MRLREMVSWETKESTAVALYGRTMTPVSQVLRVATPFGGFVWNRPVAVIVAEGDVVTRHAIVDVTRYALWAMAAGAILATLIAGRAPRRTGRKER